MSLIDYANFKEPKNFKIAGINYLTVEKIGEGC